MAKKKKRGMVASAYRSTRRAIGRYLPGKRAEAKAEAAIDNLLTLLGEARKSLRALAKARGTGPARGRKKRRAGAKRGAVKRRKSALKTRRKKRL